MSPASVREFLTQNPPEPGKPVDAKAIAAAVGVSISSAQRAIRQMGLTHATQASPRKPASVPTTAEAPGFDPDASTSVSSAPGALPAEASQTAPAPHLELPTRKAPSRRKKKTSWLASIADRAFGLFGFKLVKKAPARRPKVSA